MLRVLWIVVALNLAACSNLPESFVRCSADDCQSEETALDQQRYGLENRIILWLFNFLTFPFTVKG